jgi:hypothetical protein
MRSLHWRCCAGNGSFGADLHDVAMVRLQVRQCRDLLRFAEHAGLFGEAQACHGDAHVLVQAAQHGTAVPVSARGGVASWNLPLTQGSRSTIT